MAIVAAAMPPTPQQSFNHMIPSQSSPSTLMAQVASQTAAMPPYNHGYSMSFDNSQTQAQSQQPIQSYSHSFSNGPVSNHGYTRSFGGNNNFAPNGFEDEVQIYTAVYSGITVYEMEVHGVACMRRRADGWLNATQILKVAGVDKGKRTKVLEKEILTGEHEKVQGGYGKYQGTWISYKRGLQFCRQYGVEEVLRPLLEHDVTEDGTCGQGQETPTKEQAMAANRKRFYGTGLDSRNANGPVSNGTFFHNISPSTSLALAAMNKAARVNSPAPRPSNMRQPSQQDNFAPASQQSMMSEGSFGHDKYDAGYNAQPAGEPPRKRRRAESREGLAPPALAVDVSMQSLASTEANESFVFDQFENTTANGEPMTMPPMAAPVTEEQQDKMNIILDLFAEPNRTDYTAHQALTQLSGEDLNMPLDASANNALHWAATLAKVPLLKLLIQKGANIWRGNAVGQSPLISAVLVNNCWEHSCFPEVLELLGSLIEVRDLQGRTILHHIAVSCGIKGRAPSSKYYLEALLEFLVRIAPPPTKSFSANDHFNNAALTGPQALQMPNGEYNAQEPNPKNTVTLVRFLSHIVNARDKAGNTALNLVARIGNRSIIQQLLEIHADPNLPNYKGVSAKDFGADLEPNARINGDAASQQSLHSFQATQDTVVDEPDSLMSTSASQAEDIGQEVITSMTSLFNQSLMSHKDVLRDKSAQIDKLNEQIRESSNLQNAEEAQVQALRERVRLRAERRAKVANLKRAVEERRRNHRPTSSRHQKGRPTWLDASSQEILGFQTTDGTPNNIQRQFIMNKLPSLKVLRAYRNAYAISNAGLQREADELKSRSSDLEVMYRKVVSLCTGVAEDKVDENLSALVAAVESEQGGFGEHEVGRVRDFLRRVDSASGTEAAAI